MAKPAPSRGLRDEMNVGPDPRNARQLVPLSDLGKFQIAEGEPDVRGWTVYTSTGREIGRVHELLVDTEARQVVMLDIDLRRDDRHTLVPIRASWVDQATKRVVVDAAEIATDDAPLEATSDVTVTGAIPAVANRADVLQDWQPARPPVTRESPAVAAGDAVAPNASGRVNGDRPVLSERVVNSRPVVEEVVVRRREASPADLPDPADSEPLEEDSLLRGRPDDLADPPR